MITEKQYKEAQEIIKKYESEQLILSRTNLGKISSSSIPKEKWGVHETHCCFEHGCKYGDKDCPVELGLILQRYPCEDCED